MVKYAKYHKDCVVIVISSFQLILTTTANTILLTVMNGIFEWYVRVAESSA